MSNRRHHPAAGCAGSFSDLDGDHVDGQARSHAGQAVQWTVHLEEAAVGDTARERVLHQLRRVSSRVLLAQATARSSARRNIVRERDAHAVPGALDRSLDVPTYS